MLVGSHHKLILFAAVLSTILCWISNAEEVRYENFFAEPNKWTIGNADPSTYSSPTISSEGNYLKNQGLTFAFGNYEFEQALTLQYPDDSLDFYYAVNVHYSGGPYSSVGLGLLTLYGNTNIISGANGCNNGAFSAAINTDAPARYYSFRTVGAYDVTRIKPTVSLTDVISNQQDTVIHGKIAWDSQHEAFTAVFCVKDNTTTPIVLGSEVNITGLGISLDGSPSGSESVGNIVLIHHTDVPEPSIPALFLVATWLITFRRRAA